ncbi:hypothetical protein Sjap_016408 [Stephania japonica]|uniref:Uncharacterized protein n=1 Tax=Stephania japonica TaxID=461633 RepID=A0AAP0NUY8_9MAGN
MIRMSNDADLLESLDLKEGEFNSESAKCVGESSLLCLSLSDLRLVQCRLQRLNLMDGVPSFCAVGICAMQLVRNIYTNPEVRVTKEERAAGVLDNFAEGERYAERF